MLVLIGVGVRTVGDTDHADRDAERAQGHAEKGAHRWMPFGLADAARVGGRVVGAHRPILQNREGKDARPQRNHMEVLVEVGRGFESLNGHDIEGACCREY